MKHSFRCAGCSLPIKILVDQGGIIIGRYGGADDNAMDKKRAEIFN